MSDRFAIYFCPSEQDKWYQRGAAWLKHDIYTSSKKFRESEPLSTELKLHQSKLKRASRYGFHATLKAPFHLHRDTSLKALIQSIEEFVESHESFDCGEPLITQIDNFVAVTLPGDNSGINKFSNECVRHFDSYRSNIQSHNRLTSISGRYSERQTQNLNLWGYPYVFDDYRFHMTLSDALPDSECQLLKTLLKNYFADVMPDSIVIDSVSLLHQPDRLSRFNIIKRFPLKAKVNNLI